LFIVVISVIDRWWISAYQGRN